MRRENAYFTVEAALVFPLALGALILTVFLFIYQYDRCLMEQDMGLMVLYGRNLDAENEEEAVRMLNRRAAEIYREKYVAWQQEKMQIILEKNEIRVESEGNMIFPLPEWNFFHNNRMWRAKNVRRAMRVNPVDFIRTYRKIGGK